MGFFSEFKEFAIKGNVVDLAVGIIIGGAFGKIVSSLVADIVMPPIGFITGGVDFTKLKYTLQTNLMGLDGKPLDPVTINYGNFIQVCVDFLIVSFAIFMLIKLINKLKREDSVKQSVPPPPSNQEILLTEIRDLLKTKIES